VAKIRGVKSMGFLGGKWTSIVMASLLLVSVAEAKVLSCKADIGEDSKGWIPDRFVIDISDDRELIEVLNPVTDVFGAKAFEKAFIGSSYWSRGKGKSKQGETYNFQLQLSLKENDSRYSMELSMQGYNPLRMKGSCSESGSGGSAATSKQGSSVSVSAQECAQVFGGMDDSIAKLLFAYLKLGLVDPDQSLSDLRSSPVLAACIDKSRGAFPPIQQFIQQGQWKRPLSGAECKDLGWPEVLHVERTLAELDETFRTTAWDVSPKKAVDDWCAEIFKK
jgi:hypothetical protein